jgi:ABC-type multidrug transport system fused ATPase/permease subunit
MGEMTNLITTDTYRIENFTWYIVSLIAIPLQIILATYMLWSYLGVASLAGITSMVLFIPLNAYLTKLSRKIELKQFKLQDSRIKMLNEVFSGIRVREQG